jgi:hypothetical protein
MGILAVADVRPVHRVFGSLHVSIPFALGSWANDIVNSIAMSILYLALGGFDFYINILGFVALGLESTLPIPQLIRFVFPCHTARGVVLIGR